MKKVSGIFILLIFCAINAKGQQVTWSEDVACIVYSHCVRCHNSTNSLAAIPITNYNEAWSQRNAIKLYVENRLMPPFQPETEEVRYAHEKSLTQEEIDLIVAWVEQGSKEGNPNAAPPAPTIKPLESQISSPDIAYRIPSYTVPNIVGFQYHCFVLPNSYTQNKAISEIEILPTDLSAVYSAFLYSDTSTIPLKLDALDPSNGYENYAGTGSESWKLLYGWVNGHPKYHAPPGMGIKLDSGARLILRILFAEDAHNKRDSTAVNVKFITAPARIVDVRNLLHHKIHLLNPPFLIPADSVVTFSESNTVNSDLTVLGISHWAQKLCISLNVYAVTAPGDTIALLNIEDHEELWSQGMYTFPNPLKIPAGSTLYANATFDNSTNNSNNPFFPPKDIIAGTSDTSEQMIFSFLSLPYVSNDENIIADTIIHQNHYLNCNTTHVLNSGSAKAVERISIHPNPVSDHVQIGFAGHQFTGSITVIDAVGRIVSMNSYENSEHILLDLSKMKPGLYSLLITEAGQNFNYKILKL